MALSSTTKELVALSAAVAGNCMTCLQWHYNQCKELGIANEDVREAIEMARTVKSVPSAKIDELAEKLKQQKPKR